MASCCTCSGPGDSSAKANLPLICLVPRDKDGPPGSKGAKGGKDAPGSGFSSSHSEFQLLDEDYIKKHFKLPQRALYLDPFRRPLITFPMTQEGRTNNFNLARKQKINQQILDGFLDPSEAISAPSVFPYAKTEAEKRKESAEEEEEIIYILQLPDWEYQCPEHNQTIRTPRFIWHSCKKTGKKTNEMKKGPGPTNKPKPWVLSRITDFDLMSQW